MSGHRGELQRAATVGWAYVTAIEGFVDGEWFFARSRVCRGGVMVGVWRRVCCVLVAVVVLVPSVTVPVGAEVSADGAVADVEAVPTGDGVVGVGGFGDVDSGSVHAGAIERLAAAGVFEGTECEGGGFCPGEPLERWVMAVWLVRILDGVDPGTGGGSRFSDVEVGVWWEPYVERLADLGVTAGCATGPERFCPTRSVTRGQMATFLSRAYGLAEAGPAGFVDTAGNTHEGSIDALYAAGVTAGCRTGPFRYCPNTAVTRAQMATFLLRASTASVVAVPAPEDRAVVAEETFDRDGGVVEAGGVTVTVPEGALSEAAAVTVREPLGEFGSEVGGEVVGVDHQLPLNDAVTVRWDVSHLSEVQQLLVVMVVWDGEVGEWVPNDVDYIIEDGVMTAHLRDWSETTWLSDLFQTGLEFLGRGVDAPKCADEPLPSWVTEVGRPDAETNLAPIRLCYEAGDGGTLTMRMANNRTFSQFVETDSDDGWDGYWLGGAEVSLSWLVQLVAHRMWTTPEQVFVPKLKQVRVGIPKPSEPGSHTIGFRNGYDYRPFLADALTHVADLVPIENVGSTGALARVELFLEVVLECGVRQLVDIVTNADDARTLFNKIVAALESCGERILNPKSEAGSRLRQALSALVGHDRALTEMRTNKTFIKLKNGLKRVGKVLKLVELTADAFSKLVEAAVGRTEWHVSGKVVEGPAAGVEPFSVVSAGETHTCAIAPDESIVCWGAENEQFDHGQTDPPKGTFTAVDSGWDHACGLRTSGTITCWGQGQKTSPVRGTFVGVTAGGGHSCGLRGDGTVACWGANRHGQTNVPPGAYVAVSAGNGLTCAVRTNGTMACWGDPAFTRLIPKGGATYVSVAVGSDHACAITTHQTLKCWGSDAYGQIEKAPSGTFTAVSAFHHSTCALRTDGDILCWGAELEGGGGILHGPYTTVAMGGGYHVCASRPDGTIHCDGDNALGQLDIPDTLVGQAQPTTDGEPPRTTSGTAISAGSRHSCGIRADGTAVCWGWNEYGQLDAPSGTFTTISAAGFHSCGLRADGTVVCWGWNEYGQLDAPSGTFTTVSAGENHHSCGLRADGTAVCWGVESSGQLDAPSGSFTTISAGTAHSCGLRADGTVVCWGWNEYGQLDAPSGSFTTVSAGSLHSCGIRADGTAVCWGNNFSGRADAPSGSYTSISAGGNHSCGLRADGTAVCWGSNGDGEADAPSGSFTVISAGESHSCGIRADGTAVCWGNSSFGQSDAPSGTFALPGTGPTVTVIKGDPGPTSLNPGLGTPCAPDTPTCRYLNIQLRGFDPGDHTIACSHDGWDTTPASTWWTFNTTVGTDGTATITRQCFINFAKLTGNGVNVTVTAPGGDPVTSNYLK